MKRRDFLIQSTFAALMASTPLSLGDLMNTQEAYAAPAMNTQVPTGNRINLAAGKKVLFSPAPKDPGVETSLALTDGHIMESGNNVMWTGPAKAVDWSYLGRANLALDLGKSYSINEIGIRFSIFYLNFAHTNIPCWVEAFVSDDGVHYKKVAECSRWSDPDLFRNVDAPVNDTTSGVYYLHFPNMEDVHGRYIGLRFSGGYRVFSDELYVFGNEAENDQDASKGVPSGFSVNVPQPYFHKPELVIPTNITAPQALGIATPDSKTMKGTLTLEFDLPKEVVWDGPLENIEKMKLPDGGT